MTTSSTLSVRVVIDNDESVPVPAVVIFKHESAEAFDGYGVKPGCWYAHHVECDTRRLSESEEASAIENAWQHVA